MNLLNDEAVSWHSISPHSVFNHDRRGIQGLVSGRSSIKRRTTPRVQRNFGDVADGGRGKGNVTVA